VGIYLRLFGHCFSESSIPDRPGGSGLRILRFAMPPTDIPGISLATRDMPPVARHRIRLPLYHRSSE